MPGNFRKKMNLLLAAAGLHAVKFTLHGSRLHASRVLATTLWVGFLQILHLSWVFFMIGGEDVSSPCMCTCRCVQYSTFHEKMFAIFYGYHTVAAVAVTNFFLGSVSLLRVSGDVILWALPTLKY